MQVFLVRHGQSMANAGLTAELDSTLTDLGQAQARRTAERLSTESITHAYVSPLVRTLQTIEPICERLRLRATAFPQVCEYFSAHYPGYLTFQGLTPDDIRRRFPFVDLRDEYSCQAPWWPSNFETRQSAYQRAERVRDDLLAKYGGTEERILIVSHADPIGQLIEAFTRVAPHPEYPPWSDNCSITQLAIDDVDAPAWVIRQNDVSHLGELASIKVWK